MGYELSRRFNRNATPNSGEIDVNDRYCGYLFRVCVNAGVKFQTLTLTKETAAKRLLLPCRSCLKHPIESRSLYFEAYRHVKVSSTPTRTSFTFRKLKPEAAMGKHQLVECPRCQQRVGVTHLEAAYGCRRCKTSLAPAERERLHRARIAHNRLVKVVLRDSQTRQKELQARFGTPDALDLEFAAIRAQRGIQTPSMADRMAAEEAFFRSEVAKLEKDFTELLRSVGSIPVTPPAVPPPPAVRAPRASAPPRPPPDFIPLSDSGRTMKQLIAESAYARSVDAVMAAHNAKTIRCVCCEVCWHDGEPPFVESFDDAMNVKHLCPHCAYGVLRCGACPLHRNVIYPEIAAKVPRIHPRDYPPEVLAPFDASAFE